MIKTKAEKILIKFYKEMNNERKKNKKINYIENVMKVALIVNYLLLFIVPKVNNLKLDLSISNKPYKSDLEYIVNNFTIYGEKENED